MKNRYSIRLLVIVFLSAFAMGICYSCSDGFGKECILKQAGRFWKMR